MSTLTSQRVACALRIPNQLLNAINKEIEPEQMPFTAFVRRALRWHTGQGLARRSDLPPVRIGKATGKTTQKMVHLDDSDVNYIDKSGAILGMTRSMVLVLILAQYLGIPILPPTERKE